MMHGKDDKVSSYICAPFSELQIEQRLLCAAQELVCIVAMQCIHNTPYHMDGTPHAWYAPNNILHHTHYTDATPLTCCLQLGLV